MWHKDEFDTIDSIVCLFDHHQADLAESIAVYHRLVGLWNALWPLQLPRLKGMPSLLRLSLLAQELLLVRDGL